MHRPDATNVDAAVDRASEIITRRRAFVGDSALTALLVRLPFLALHVGVRVGAGHTPQLLNGCPYGGARALRACAQVAEQPDGYSCQLQGLGAGIAGWQPQGNGAALFCSTDGASVALWQLQ